MVTKIKTFCGQCGSENLEGNNFCSKCGNKLKTLEPVIIEKGFNPKLKIIEQTLRKLINHEGFLIISLGDYYVQFYNDLKKKELTFEAVSHYNLQEVGNKKSEFKKLSFKIEDSNYIKIISHTDLSIDNVIVDVEIIFKDIYCRELIDFKIETELDGDYRVLEIHKDNLEKKDDKLKKIPEYKLAPIKLTTSQRNWIIAVVIIIVLFIIGNLGDDDSSSPSSLYYINTTTYAGTSKSNFDATFNYAYDKDEEALASLILNGHIELLTVGTEVYLVSSHISYCIVRLSGSTQNLWVVTEHITQK